MTHLFESATIDPDTTLSREVDLNRSDVNLALFFVGDNDSADVTLSFYTKPHGEDVAEWFLHFHESEKNIDITSGRVYEVKITPAHKARVEITNNGTNATTIDAFAKRYLAHW